MSLRRTQLQRHSRRMRTRLLTALTSALWALSPDASNADQRTLSAEEFYAEVASSGRVIGPATVDDDIDLGSLSSAAVPAGKAILFDKVYFRGRLIGVPTVRLRFQGGTMCRIEAEGRAWPEAVELQNVTIGAARFREARLGGTWTCFECTICRANFEEARFSDEASFIGTRFGVSVAAELCGDAGPRTCGTANFAEASFAALARFDRTEFQTRLSIDGAEFRDIARFPRLMAPNGLSAIGTRFRRDAEFRDCTLTDASFGPDLLASQHTTVEATEFGARADFRGCHFDGTTSFDATVFTGDALYGRARFAGPKASLLGVLPAKSIDFRAAILSDQTELALDATAADAIRIDWEVGGSSMLRALRTLSSDQRAPTLDALSRRLREQGDERAALRVAYEAKQARRSHRCSEDSLMGCVAADAEWWLWTWPTRNGSDVTWPLAASAILWAATVLAGLPRGRILAIPEDRSEEQSVAGASYRCMETAALPEGSSCPVGLGRVERAIGFATRLVLKFGSPRLRMVAPETPAGLVLANSALLFVWLLGWGLMAVVAAVIASSFPGLRAIVP
jgi:hypothetical protein